MKLVLLCMTALCSHIKISEEHRKRMDKIGPFLNPHFEPTDALLSLYEAKTPEERELRLKEYIDAGLTDSFEEEIKKAKETRGIPNENIPIQASKFNKK